MPDDKFPTPPGWRRNARGFDEAPNSSPSAKAVFVFVGGIAALIFAVFLIARFT
jgi:hypothetical protein